MIGVFRKAALTGVLIASFCTSVSAKPAIKNGEKYSIKSLNQQKFNIGCVNVQNNPRKFVDFVDRRGFHGGNPGTVDIFMQSTTERDARLKKLSKYPFPIKGMKEKIATYQKFAIKYDKEQTDNGRAAVLEEILEFSHQKEFKKFKQTNGTGFFDSVRQDCGISYSFSK